MSKPPATIKGRTPVPYRKAEGPLLAQRGRVGARPSWPTAKQALCYFARFQSTTID